MKSYVYTAWFRDPDLEPGDEDYEWPACINIVAKSLKAAQSWGDYLAKRRATRAPSAVFLSSEVEYSLEPEENLELPKVIDGEDAPDGLIGW